MTLFTFIAQAQAAKGTSAVTVALIGAGAAVVGALIGGAVTGYVTLRAERKRQEFQQADREAAWNREDEERGYRPECRLGSSTRNSSEHASSLRRYVG